MNKIACPDWMAENAERGSKSPPRNTAAGRSLMIDAKSLSYRSVCPCRSVAKKQVGKTNPFRCFCSQFYSPINSHGKADVKRRVQPRLASRTKNRSTSAILSLESCCTRVCLKNFLRLCRPVAIVAGDRPRSLIAAMRPVIMPEIWDITCGC